MLELLEGRFPEFEVKDFALTRKEVVLDAKAEHGFKMAAEDGGGDEVGDFGGVVAAVLDEVQGVEAQLFARGLFLVGALAVPLRGAGVEIPAVVVDALAFARSLAVERAARTSAGDFFSRCRKPTTTSATWTPVLSM